MNSACCETGGMPQPLAMKKEDIVRRDLALRIERLIGAKVESYMPKLVAWEDHESAPILVIEDLSASHWPPPWDERWVELVLAQIHAMHHTQVSLASYAQVHGVRGANWPAVAADPTPFLSLGLADARWLDEALPLLIRYEAQCSTDGESLTHWDFRSD